MDELSWCLFRGDQLLVLEQKTNWCVPRISSPLQWGIIPTCEWHLGFFGGQHWAIAELLPDVQAPAGYSFRSFRSILANPNPLALWVGRAKQLLHWHRTTQFCGACGVETILDSTQPAKRCIACDRLWFPRVTPAILALLTRGRELLLGRSPHFPAGQYSLLAGFVDVGETLEEAVAREVREEVGLQIGLPAYRGSQSWPFPSQLMVGFHAVYESGELCLDPEEIEDARWFSPEKLPSELPHLGSLSRRMIDEFLKG